MGERVGSMPARRASLTALATPWLGVTDDDHERRDVAERLAAMLWRPEQEGVLIQA